MSRYSLTPQAKRELRQIVDWYRENRGVRSARKVGRDFREKFQLIASRPGIGRAREEFAPANTRFFLHHLYFLVGYLPDTDPVQIVRVVDVRRLK